MAKRSKKKNKQALWWLCFIPYAGLMIWLLFCRPQTWIEGLSYQQMLLENINWKPFYTIRNYVNVIFHYPDSYYYEHCIINLVGNVVMFLPAGFLLPHLFKRMRKFWCFLLTTLIGILFIELLQLFALVGSFDVDDILLNLLGTILGYLAFLCTVKK